MQNPSEANAPVRTKAVLVDPETMSVLWMNESACEDFADGGGDFAGVPIDRAMPMAEMLGVPEALRAVAGTGLPRHLRINLVSTTKGSVAIATSVYRLPDGKVLVLTENAWQAAHAKATDSAQRRSGPRAR